MKKQAFNPYLPLDEYIPDGEPHVFGDRVYIYGSHDREGGYTFCMDDYTVYSAALDDLGNWRKEGVIYRASQDPLYPKYKYMYAPDVVQGNDGKYYLYYAMSGDYGVGGYKNPISVAVCDTPAGEYKFLGVVKNPDGSPMMKYVCFDPAVINDGGVIRIYYGTQYGFEEEDDFPENEAYIQSEMDMFGRSREEILSYEDSIMGPVSAVLCDDMLTIKEEAKHIIPYKVKGTSFEEHPFFEASSMRKVNDKYYFVYSSMQNHELCYAVSDKPDSGFTFGGTIVSNGDIGYNGITENNKKNMTGTTHGSIVKILDDWYVFYHRLTHKSDYSRQACAEKIHIAEDGSISQVEITSCGLNGGPLIGKGSYPAVIACNITNGRMPHGCNSIFKESFPNVTNIGDDRFIGEIENGTLIGFKYFNFDNLTNIEIKARIETENNKANFDVPLRVDGRSAKVTNMDYSDMENEECYFEVKLGQEDEAISKIYITKGEDDSKWLTFNTDVKVAGGVYPVFLIYHGKYRCQLKEISFC